MLNDCGEEPKKTKSNNIVFIALAGVIIFYVGILSSNKSQSTNQSSESKTISEITVSTRSETNEKKELTISQVNMAKTEAQEYVEELKKKQANINNASYTDHYEIDDDMIKFQYMITYKNDETLRHVCDVKVQVYDDYAIVLGTDVVYTLDSDN